ncbi:hypothetical protein [Rhizobium alvei]|uniref:Uncharacterized protein n=1 Tax=Rhizobium alvei TaxID=1132659 RepID=A0ABT8YTF2_9HYPH|nr:hypothetical protein [Rhizobium alvei]MDO6967016.1 hypothetical protein [Rhizobium alvei]
MRVDVSSNPPVLVAYIQPITAAEARAAYGAVIQSMLDEKARSRGYDSIASAISYRGDGNMQFAAEAEALFAWRSAVWTYSAAELDRVLEGLRIQPAIEAFLEEVEAACPFAWP